LRTSSDSVALTPKSWRWVSLFSIARVEPSRAASVACATVGSTTLRKFKPTLNWHECQFYCREHVPSGFAFRDDGLAQSRKSAFQREDSNLRKEISFFSLGAQPIPG